MDRVRPGYAGAHTASQHGRPRTFEERTAAKEQMMQSVRESSQQDRRVYVGNLAQDVKWHHLKDFMRQAGEVHFADVLLLPNGMSKGCGIVEYATKEQAQQAIQTLSHQSLMGRLVHVREDRGPEPRFTSPSAGITNSDITYDRASRGSTEPNLSYYGRGRFESGYDGGFARVDATKYLRRSGRPGNAEQDIRVSSNPFTDLATSGGERSQIVHVRNLPWSTTNEDLVELFTTIGKVDKADIQYEESGRSRGTGVVQFTTADDAETAISKFTGYLYGGRPLGLSFVKYIEDPTNPSTEHTLPQSEASFDRDALFRRLSVLRLTADALRSFNAPIVVMGEASASWLLAEWEIPLLLSQSPTQDVSKVRTRDPLESAVSPNWIGDVLAISGNSTNYEVSTAYEFLQKYWGQVGLDVLQALGYALQLKGTTISYSIGGLFCWVGAFSSCLIVEFTSHIPPNLTNNLRNTTLTDEQVDSAPNSQSLRQSITSAIKWLCQALRPSSKPSRDSPSQSLYLSRSRHLFPGFIEAITLDDLSPLKFDHSTRHGCWTALFTGAVVAEHDLQRTWGRGLEIPFELMLQLSGVDNYAWLDEEMESCASSTIRGGGYIAVGFFSALVPVERTLGGTQWHLEYTDDEPLSLADLSTKRGLRSAVTDLSSVSYEPCFLGWCENAEILLGTAELPNTVSWSGLSQRKQIVRPSGYNATAQFGTNLGPVQAIGQLTKEWKIDNTRLRFEPSSSYAKAIQVSSRHVALVFDTSSRRAWFVPKLSLMLHLCHTYVRHFSDPGTASQPQVPFAQPSTDGSLAAKQALWGQGDLVVFAHGADQQDQLRLRNILVDISTNISRSISVGENPRFLRALAPELMDVLAEPGTGALLSEVPIDCFPSPATSSFAQLADSIYVCSDLGPAIRPVIPPGIVTCDCLNLECDRGYLGVHLRSLETCLQRRNKSLRQLGTSPLPIGEHVRWWLHPVTPCAHVSTRSFWKEPREFMQSVSRAKVQRPNAPRTVPAIEGAVVFGGADGLWQRIFNVLQHRFTAV